MRFGGHQTFHIREGWLHKGLRLLADDPDLFHAPEAADALGVGGNMVKAIRHWLLATGLNYKPGGAKLPAELTTIGQEVLRYDPFFTSEATWWALHVNIASNPYYAASWHWLFNFSGLHRFEKGVAIEQMRRHLRHHSNLRLPALATHSRDFSVLLSSYSRTIPHELNDPEDSKYCPFQRLDLITFFRESGFYRINFADKPIPPQMLGYALSRMVAVDGLDGKPVSRSITEISTAEGGPGKLFCLRPEAMFDLALAAQDALGSNLLEVTGLAGNRMVRFRSDPPELWLRNYYQEQLASEEELRVGIETTLLNPYE